MILAGENSCCCNSTRAFQIPTVCVSSFDGLAVRLRIVRSSQSLDAHSSVRPRTVFSTPTLHYCRSMSQISRYCPATFGDAELVPVAQVSFCARASNRMQGGRPGPPSESLTRQSVFPPPSCAFGCIQKSASAGGKRGTVANDDEVDADSSRSLASEMMDPEEPTDAEVREYRRLCKNVLCTAQ
jgi:hypothetical protein